MKLHYFFPLVAAVLSLVALAEDEHRAFHFVEDDLGVTVLDGIRPVLTYQRAPQSKAGAWPRSNYVHPLYDLDGELITEDFPRDHGHHRGIFWAWHQVLVGEKQIGDAWACEDFEWDVRRVECRSSSERAEIDAEVLWKSPALTDSTGTTKVPIVREQSTIVVHRQLDDVRMVDFEIRLLALVDAVSIGGSNDEKGYGGFSPRIKLGQDQVFRGSAGEVEPLTTQINAGPWIDISNNERGLAILTHRENPGYPQPWILRRAKSMQNVVYPGRTPVALSSSQPLVLRYRLVLHRGNLTPARIDQIQAQF